MMITEEPKDKASFFSFSAICFLSTVKTSSRYNPVYNQPHFTRGLLLSLGSVLGNYVLVTN
jgi:hypothetical protein